MDKMKILVVCSGNHSSLSSFVLEQMEEVEKHGIEVHYFLIEGHGVLGYLRMLPRYRKCIKKECPNLIHAHFGLSGLFANMQRSVPVVTTYHGCDINDRHLRVFSQLSIWLSRYNIFVSESQKKMVQLCDQNRSSVLPCGVDLCRFYRSNKEEMRDKFHFLNEKRYVLFSSSFDRRVKNSGLAKAAVSKLNDVELLELKGYDREQVRELMCAVDAGLLTSNSEGSSMFLKELIACGCPFVSTPVGDAPDQVKHVNGGYISSFEVQDVAHSLLKAMDCSELTYDTEWVKQYSCHAVVEQLIDIYGFVVKKKICVESQE